MTNSPHTPNGFVRFMRKIYHPIGFQKGYNFILWFIFAGALFFFSLARFEYLSWPRYSKGSAPGEMYFMNRSFYKSGLLLHLGTILPAGILAVLQFTPFIRHKVRLFHRINGYVVMLLLLTSLVGALMITRHAFGGTIETQMLMGVLAIMVTVSVVLAYVNIKRLQIEEHRAWMLRTWFYAASIITLRLIMIISALIITKMTAGKADGDDVYYRPMSCGQVMGTFENKIEPAAKAVMMASKAFAQCFELGGKTLLAEKIIPVRATFDGTVPEIGASLEISFGAAGWLALVLHAVGVEIYLRLTPRENERLRKVSYQRQLEAGFRSPGSAGLVKERLGDAEPWVMPEEKVEVVRDYVSNQSVNEVSSRGSGIGEEVLEKGVNDEELRRQDGLR